jgi:hypothetical protein
MPVHDWARVFDGAFHDFHEPVAIGDVLIDMPLFLAPGWYVSVPVEATYQAAWRGVPRRFREVLERPNRDG